MSVLFQHAMRYEWAPANPVRLVRQSALPVEEKIALSSVEIAALLTELRDPFRCLILLASVTGLRRGELFGLKWEDIDFNKAEFRIVRSMVDQVEGPPKTLASRRPIPMSGELATALNNWREQTIYSKPEDWVFASPLAVGRRPYWPDATLKRHVLPAAIRAGITKRIGWHSFRHSLASLLGQKGEDLKVVQELLRHASSRITQDVYQQASQDAKRNALSRMSGIFVVPPTKSA